MSTYEASRNAFAAENQISVADLIAQIQAAGELPKLTKQNWCWALRTVARMGGKEPVGVPANPEFLRRLMAKATPLAAGLSSAAWNNARSLAGKAMEWAGLASMPRHYMAPFSPDWAALWPLLPPKTALSYQVSRFMHYGSARGISPSAVNDEVFGDFYKALTEESLVEDPYEAYRGAAKNWNNAVATIPGWPLATVTVPSRRLLPFSLPATIYPQGLQQEIDGYKKAAAGMSIKFDFDRPQAPSTIAKRDKQLRWYFSALVHSGVEASDLTSLASLLEPTMVMRGLQYLLDRRGARFPALDNLAKFLPALARRIELPQATIDELKRLKRRVKFEHHGLAERHRPTLERFNDPAAVEALVMLPRKLREFVEKSPRKGRREAKLLQTAVAIEILLVAPVRVSNLASILTDIHLKIVSTNPEEVHLCFEASEVKNKVGLEFPLPEETLELIRLYQRDYLHLLAKDPGNFLFPGKKAGRCKVPHALSLQIKRTVYKFTNLEMPAHRFRHAAGKIFLDKNPGQYEVVRLLLGHRKIETTIAFYAGAEGPEAARHYARTILAARRRT